MSRGRVGPVTSESAANYPGWSPAEHRRGSAQRIRLSPGNVRQVVVLPLPFLGNGTSSNPVMVADSPHCGARRAGKLEDAHDTPVQ